MKEVPKLIIGSVIVYVVMIFCLTIMEQHVLKTIKIYVNEDTAYVEYNGQVHQYDYTVINGKLQLK